ncbi:MAG: LysR family transcriptional regulator [Betaproteobacteria bacterium]|nr:LysR family transcriptional regulator [Betaproteobacteria bacterium]
MPNPSPANLALLPADLSLDDLRLFCRVARLGTLSAVARERNVPVSQISRMLQRIEAAYGVRLVHRSTHGLSLTPEGERFHESAERVVLELESLGDDLHGFQQTVSGLVRVAASASVAELVIVPSLASLMARHPALRIDLRVNDQVVDMAHEGIDIAIRTGEPTSDQWVMRRLGYLNRRLYASPAYLKHHGTPDSVQALDAHRLIMHSVQPHLNRWTLNNGADAHHLHASGPLMTDSSATLVAMALAGLGIARVPSVVSQPLVALGQLCEVLPPWSDHESIAVSAVMLAQRHRLPKVRACVDHWVQWFAQLSDNPDS